MRTPKHKDTIVLNRALQRKFVQTWKQLNLYSCQGSHHFHLKYKENKKAWTYLCCMGYESLYQCIYESFN